MNYIPERGDFVWLTFDPQAGHEQAGRRPALILSPSAYNGKVGLALVCPLTNKAKGYAYEVAIPGELGVSGVILADQVRNMDWRARQAVFIAKAPPPIIHDVLERLDTLLR